MPELYSEYAGLPEKWATPLHTMSGLTPRSPAGGHRSQPWPLLRRIPQLSPVIFPPHLWTYQVRPTYFDLWGLSRDQLASAGLKPERLEIAGLCTRCRGDEFFSYRREGLTGRQGAVIALRQ